MIGRAKTHYGQQAENTPEMLNDIDLNIMVEFQIVEEFNKFFSKIGIKLANSMDKCIDNHLHVVLNLYLFNSTIHSFP